MKAKTLFLSLLVAATCGCHKIYLHNGDTGAARPATGDWHHVGVFGLVEFSEPVNLNNKCSGKDWKVVRTQRDFVQGLVGAVTWGLYTPWDAAYECRG